MSENTQFVRVLASHEYETITFPKQALYDKNLSGNSLKILLIMLDFGKRPNWQLRQNHLISESGMGYEKYNTAIKNLVLAGYVQRTRERKKGKLGAYIYQFCAFPVFLPKETEKCPHNEFQPDRVFQTGETKLENPDYTYSYNNNVLEETTKPPEKKNPSGEIGLVGSSFQELEDLERLQRISASQKRTLYSKFTHDQILKALNCVDISKAESVFALLYSAIEKSYQPSQTSKEINSEAVKLYQEAEKFLTRRGSNLISLGIDEKNVYIFMGTARSVYPMNDPEFRSKFIKSINQYSKS